MKIVILGYSGSIGNSILEKLARNKSFEIVCIGRDIVNKFNKNKRIKYFKWDFNSFKKSNLFFLKKADVIINCIGKTNDNLNNLKNINVIFVKKLLKYISTFRIKIRFIQLSSVSVYGQSKKFFGQKKIISENTSIDAGSIYSKSKIEADLLIEDVVKNKINKNFSYTILRISNVFGKKKSNLYSYVLFSLKYGFWIKSSNETMFNFINEKDVSQAINLIISKLNISKNKIYIVSDDCKQSDVYENYNKFYKKKIINFLFPIKLINFLINYFLMPKILLNFFLTISSKVSYSNKKIKKELNFKPKFSLIKKL